MSENYSYNDPQINDQNSLRYAANSIPMSTNSSINSILPSNQLQNSFTIQDSSPNNSNLLISTRKRSRSTKACIACHNKKIKCDLAQKADNIKCSNCETCGIQCDLYIRKKRGANKKPKILNLSNNKKELSTIKQSLSSVNLLSANLNDIESHPEDNIKSTSTSIPIFKSDFLKDSLNDKYKNLSKIKLDPNLILKENMNGLMMTEFGINEASNNSFMKKIINIALPKMTQDFKRSYILDQLDFEMLDRFGCFSLPDEETCKSYIDNFFEFINPQLPIIDKINFYQNYKDLKNPPSLLLLHSVLSVGAWHMNIDPSNPNDQLENVEKSRILFKRAKLLFQYSIEVDAINVLQSVLCFTFHHDNMSNLAKNDYYWTHVAVNLAFQYGFHLLPSKSFTPYIRKIRKRLWWIVYLKDRLTAFGYSKPCLINLSESDIDMLTIKDFDNSGLSYLELLYIINLIKFGKLIDQINDTQNEISKIYPLGKPIIHLMKKCDILMINYLENLPKELIFKVSDPSTQSFLSSMLMSHYYTMLTVIHRANIQRHTTDIYPSWAISFQAAQMIKILCDCFVSKRLVSKVATLSHNTLTSCCIIMIYHLLNEDKKISHIAKEFFSRVLGIWRSTYRKFPNVYPMLCIFDTIYNSESYLKQIVKSLIPQNKTDKTSKMPSSLKLPDLSFITNPDFQISSNDINRTQTSVKFDNLGIDFNRLFTDKVFSEGSTYTPKLNLEKISKKITTKNDNSIKPIKSEPIPSSDPLHSVDQNMYGKTTIPLTNIHNKDTQLIDSDTAIGTTPITAPIIATPTVPETIAPGTIAPGTVPVTAPPLATDTNRNDKSYFFQQGSNSENTAPVIDTNNIDLGLPDSLWVMQTNWQPKFSVNTEVSDNSMETIEERVSLDIGDQHNSKPNFFYSDTYNIMGDPTFGTHDQFGYNITDERTGTWNNNPSLINKKVQTFPDDRYVSTVFDMEHQQGTTDQNDRLIPPYPAQFPEHLTQTQQQQQPPPLPPPPPQQQQQHHHYNNTNFSYYQPPAIHSPISNITNHHYISTATDQGIYQGHHSQYQTMNPQYQQTPVVPQPTPLQQQLKTQTEMHYPIPSPKFNNG